MSIMTCDKCGNLTDTDFEEMFEIPDKYEVWCNYCYDKWVEENERESERSL